VEDALATDGLQIIGCNVHMGDELGPHAVTDLEQLKTELNQFVQRFDWKDQKISVTHGWLTAEHVIAPVRVTLTLERWYGVDQPRRAFYGLVTAGQLAVLYQQHGKALFEKNIRHISAHRWLIPQSLPQLKTAPLSFFISIMASPPSARHHASTWSNQSTGWFTLQGFSVVMERRL